MYQQIYKSDDPPNTSSLFQVVFRTEKEIKSAYTETMALIYMAAFAYYSIPDRSRKEYSRLYRAWQISIQEFYNFISKDQDVYYVTSLYMKTYIKIPNNVKIHSRAIIQRVRKSRFKSLLKDMPQTEKEWYQTFTQVQELEEKIRSEADENEYQEFLAYKNEADNYDSTVKKKVMVQLLLPKFFYPMSKAFVLGSRIHDELYPKKPTMQRRLSNLFKRDGYSHSRKM